MYDIGFEPRLDPPEERCDENEHWYNGLCEIVDVDDLEDEDDE